MFPKKGRLVEMESRAVVAVGYKWKWGLTTNRHSKQGDDENV